MNVQQSSTLRDFKIVQELGKGSFSQVYKVIRIADGKEYALKKVQLGMLKQKEKENALNEVRLLASIHNENIVAYKEAFLDDSMKYLCIVMELLSGGDVFRRINQAIKGGPQFNESEIWRALINITLGLKALHDQKIVHRDLKSANVFLSSEGNFKLGDLNVSKVAKQGFVYTQTGTPYYASPEVWRDDPYDMKSDMWSLGCVIYEMCTLLTPFRAKEMDVLYQKVQKGVYDPIPIKYSKDLGQVISLLLKPSANQRPNCDQLLQNPIVMKHMEKIEPIITQPQNQELLKTIQVPVNFDQLKNKFPKSNYERNSEKGYDNKSTENSTCRFGNSQQQTKTAQNQTQSQVLERHSTEIVPNYSYLGREIKHPLLVEGPRPLTKRTIQSANLLSKESDSKSLELKLIRLKEQQKQREIKEKNLQSIRDVNMKEIQMMKNKELQNLKESLDAQQKIIRENRKVSPISQKLQINYQPQAKSYSPISRSIESSQYNQNKIVSNQLASLQQANQLIHNGSQLKQPPYKSTPTIRRRYAPQSAGPQSQYYYGNNNNQCKPSVQRYVHPQSAMPSRSEQQRIEMSQVFPMQARVLKQKLTLNNLNNENKLPKREILFKPTRPASSNLLLKEKIQQQDCQLSLAAQNYNHYYPIENYTRNSSDQNLIRQKLQQQEARMQLLLGKRNS